MGTSRGDTKNFPDMVAYMDEVVGRLADELGLRANTLILYYCDNGTVRKIASLTVFGSVAGGKGSTLNAGTHVPELNDTC